MTDIMADHRKRLKGLMLYNITVVAGNPEKLELYFEESGGAEDGEIKARLVITPIIKSNAVTIGAEVVTTVSGHLFINSQDAVKDKQ